MYIAGSYFVLICRWQSRQHSEDFSRVYDPRYGPHSTHVFFFSESIMLDESDLHCFKGHILHEDIDRAVLVFKKKIYM